MGRGRALALWGHHDEGMVEKRVLGEWGKIGWGAWESEGQWIEDPWESEGLWDAGSQI